MGKDYITQRITDNLAKQLKTLDLSNCQLKSLPEEVCNLKHLKRLILNGNPLRQLPEYIGLLENLTEIQMIGTQLHVLPDSFCWLQRLTVLALDNGELNSLPEDFGRLASLRRLYLNSNRLSLLPASLGQLSCLVELVLHSNQLVELPESFCMLRNLRSLCMFDNKLRRLPKSFGSLRRLEYLDLDRNSIESLPDSLCELQHLTSFTMMANRLVDLPTGMERLIALKHLCLIDNQLPIPPEIVVQTNRPDEILYYYAAHYKKDLAKRPINEAKLIVVGEGSVGKTSLVKRLVFDTFDPSESITEGINITDWQFPLNGSSIRLHVWDFGGQEIMHATHQFFLTQRSLYVLVLDSRLDEYANRIEYWLKIIESFGGESPILVVCNKSDQRQLDLDWKGLKTKYPALSGFVRRFSCQEGYGIDELREAIACKLRGLSHVTDLMLSTWFAVKNELEKANMDFISFSQYRCICSKHGVLEDVSQRTLIGFLHDLGIVLHFRDHPNLNLTSVLNPQWVTQGVYQIITSSQLFENRGVLDVQWLIDILDSTRYPEGRYAYILEMMQKFELCFAFEGHKGTRFLIPDLLQKESPDTGSWDGSLHFRYRYSVLPHSIISRFIVRMHAYISRNTYWRSGVVLVSEDGANRALVKSDIEDKQIDIQVDGPTDQRRSFLSLLRADFLKIHATLPSLDVEEKIPLTDTPDVEIDYQHLLKLEERGIQTFWPEGYDRELNVSALLNGIEMRYGPPIHSSLVPPSSIPLSTPSEAGTGTEVIPRHILQEYEKSKVSPSEKLLAAISGIAFLLILLAIALFVPNPTNFQLFTFRVVLAISAGAFASLLSGFICVHGSFQRLLIRAGGGFAVFVIIFALNPPKLISSSVNDGSPKEGHIKTIRSDDHGIYTRISE